MVELINRLKLKLIKKNKCQMKMEAVREILQFARFNTLYQNIVSLQDHHIVAKEYLNRPLPGLGFEHAGEFYSFAASHGAIADVDYVAFKQVIHEVPTSPPFDNKHFVNIHLSSLFHPAWDELVQMIEKSSIRPQDVVLELSEREGLDKYSRKEVEYKLKQIKDVGFQLAVDDVGVGYSGLTTLAIVKPDFIKLDRKLVDHIDQDRYRQGMMASLVGFWLDEETSIIAEGIERKEEAQFFKEIGAQLAQGYLFHKPEPIAE